MDEEKQSLLEPLKHNHDWTLWLPGELADYDDADYSDRCLSVLGDVFVCRQPGCPTLWFVPLRDDLRPGEVTMKKTSRGSDERDAN